MAIKLARDVRKRSIMSIRRYFTENMEDEVGDLKAQLLLDFFLKEIGPIVYNHAIADAQSYFQERTGDLDGACHEPEFGFWN